MHHCSAIIKERIRVQRRKMMFRSQDSGRLRIPGKQKSRCSKLSVEGKLIPDPEKLMADWLGHFKKLAAS